MGTFSCVYRPTVNKGGSGREPSLLYSMLERKYGRFIADRYYVLACSEEPRINKLLAGKSTIDQASLDEIREKYYNHYPNGVNVEWELKPQIFEKLLSKLDPDRTTIIDTEKTLGFRNDNNSYVEFSKDELQNAMLKAQTFNKDRLTNSKYVAVVKEVKGNYIVKIVESKSSEAKRFTNFIKNLSLYNKLQYWFSRIGIKFDISNSTDPYYNLDNMEQIMDSYYTLLQVEPGSLEGYTRAMKVLLDAITESGKNTEFVDRLVNLVHSREGFIEELDRKLDNKFITEEAAKFTDEREKARYYAAAILAERAMTNKLNLNNSIISRLHFRLKSMINSLREETPGDFKKTLKDSKILADKILLGFTNYEFNGKYQPELATAANEGINLINTPLRMFKEMAVRAEKFYKTMSQISYKMERDFLTNIQEIKSKTLSGEVVNVDGTVTYNIIKSGIIELAKQVNSKAHQIGSYLDYVESHSYECNYKNVNSLKSAMVIYDLVQDTIYQLQLFLNYATEVPDPLSTNKDVKAYLDSLIAFKTCFDQRLANAQLNISVNLISEYTGREFIELADRGIKFSDVKFKKSGGLNTETLRAKSIKDLFTESNEDTNLLARFVLSMCDQTDPILSLYDSAFKQQRRTIDNETIQNMDVIRNEAYKYENFISSIYDRSSANYNTEESQYLREFFKTHRAEGMAWLYDTGYNEQMDGSWHAYYIIGEGKDQKRVYYHCGRYSDEYQKFYEETKDEIKARLKANDPEFSKRSSDYIALKIAEEMEDKVKAWHTIHSISIPVKNKKGEEGVRYEANVDIYGDAEFAELMEKCPTLRGFYDNIIELKRKKTGYLPGGFRDYLVFRAPQIKGRTIIRQRNITDAYGASSIKRRFGSLRRELAENIVVDVNDTEFGSDDNYNDLEKDLFGDTSDYTFEKFNRIPLYGINKLHNMLDLSTDAFQSLLAFCNMSNSYLGLKEVAASAEILRETVRDKGVNNVYTTKKEDTNSYKRLSKYIDRNIYGLHYSSPKSHFSRVCNKLVNYLNGIGSKIALSGNPAGGVVNTLSGFNEITKEAISGEWFTLKDLEWANDIYTNEIILRLNPLRFGEQQLDDKVSLFIREMDILNDNNELFNNFNVTKNRVSEILGKVEMAPYSSGEHWMQTIPYLAVAHRTLVYDSINKKVINLYDAYDVVPTDEKDPNSPKTLKLRNGIYLNEDASRKNTILDGIISKLEEAKKTDTLLLSKEESDLLVKEFNITIDTDFISGRAQENIERVRKAQDKLKFTKFNSNQFGDLVRQLDNRMHGVYNTIDGVELQQYILGKLALTMKGYMIGYANRRFAPLHYNAVLDKWVEGSAISEAKAMFATLCESVSERSIAPTMNFLLLAMLPLNRLGMDYLDSLGFSAHQIANIKRMSTDAYLIQILRALQYLFLSLSGGSGDDSDKGWGLAYYFATRALMEQEAFNNIPGIVREAAGFSLLPTGLSVDFQMAQALVEMIEGDVYGPHSQYAGKNKGIVKWHKKMPYIRFKYTLDNPVKATQNYEFSLRRGTRDNGNLLNKVLNKDNQ